MSTSTVTSKDLVSRIQAAPSSKLSAEAEFWADFATILGRIEESEVPHTPEEVEDQAKVQAEHRQELITAARQILAEVKDMPSPGFRHVRIDELTVLVHDISLEIMGSCSCGTKSPEPAAHLESCAFKHLSECEVQLYARISSWADEARKNTAA